MNEYLFNILTPLNFNVHTSHEYWEKIIIKHPELKDKLPAVQKTIKEPAEIRKSKRDELIFLFYSEDIKYWLCAVVKKPGAEGFLVTAYITDNIKEGEIIWRK